MSDTSQHIANYVASELQSVHHRKLQEIQHQISRIQQPEIPAPPSKPTPSSETYQQLDSLNDLLSAFSTQLSHLESSMTQAESTLNLKLNLSLSLAQFLPAKGPLYLRQWPHQSLAPPDLTKYNLPTHPPASRPPP